MTTLSLRQTLSLVAVFVATSLAFIQLDNRQALDPVKSVLQDLLLPVSRAFDRLAPDDNGDIPGNPALEEEVARLTQANDALIAENAQLKVQADENAQLRAQLDVKQKNPELQLLSARVVNEDPANQDKFIIIDKGSAAGIREGMAVVSPYYFVGQVTDVDENTARVTLVIDNSYLVAARLQDSGANGIVYGKWQDGGRLELHHVNRDTQVDDGELVVTSDSDELRTQGVPGVHIIGRVEGEAQRSNQDDSLIIKVVPAVNFDTLQVVSVILADVAPQS